MTNKENNSIIAHPEHSNENKRINDKKLIQEQLSVIKKLRHKIKVWDDFEEKIENKLYDKYFPVKYNYAIINTKIVHVLDAAYQQTNEVLNDEFKDQLADIIIELANLSSEYRYDPEISDLFMKYTEIQVGKMTLENIDHFIDDHEMMQMLMRDAEVLEGLRFPKDFNPTSFLEAMDKVEELRAEKKKRDENKLIIEMPDGSFRRKPSLKTIYRKLASSLHPDRETDPIKREEKTQLMQRVNKEYKQKNLKNLIQLQSEIEVIEEIDITTLHEDEVQRELLILKQQVEDLSDELYKAEQHYRYEYNVENPTPQKVNKALNEIILNMKKDSKHKESIFNKISKDFSALKEWVILYHNENFE